MKKVICMIALGAVCLGAVSASPIRSVQDTAKVKTKFKHHNVKVKAKTPTTKIKTKVKDTAKR